MNEISVSKLKMKLENRDDFILLDVRTKLEYDNEKIGDPLHIPLNELDKRIEELDKSEEIIIYCQTGARSVYATLFLKGRGFDVKNLVGGIKKWKAQHL